MGISDMFSEKEANFTGLTEDENYLYVNDFMSVTTLNTEYNQIDLNSSTIEHANGFELGSPFVFIVAEAKTKIPLLIGTFANSQAYEPTKAKLCKIPDIKNGFATKAFGEKLEANEVICDDTFFDFECLPGYVMDIVEDEQFDESFCKAGWETVFPKCISTV